jgi:hypothetical protein
MGKPAVNRRSLALIGVLAALGLAAALAVATPSAAGAQTRGHREGFKVVADHLNNPRGLSPAPGGGLYLAEAGSGGGVCVAGGEQGQTCVGRHGPAAVPDRWPGGPHQVITG